MRMWRTAVDVFRIRPKSIGEPEAITLAKPSNSTETVGPAIPTALRITSVELIRRIALYALASSGVNLTRTSTCCPGAISYGMTGKFVTTNPWPDAVGGLESVIDAVVAFFSRK